MAAQAMRSRVKASVLQKSDLCPPDVCVVVHEHEDALSVRYQTFGDPKLALENSEISNNPGNVGGFFVMSDKFGNFQHILKFSTY